MPESRIYSWHHYPQTQCNVSSKIFFEAVFKLMWSFLAPTLKPAMPNRVSHACLYLMMIPAQNLLRNTETNTPRPRGPIVPNLTSRTNNLPNQALRSRFRPSTLGSATECGYCRAAEVWPCLVRQILIFPKALPVSLNRGKAGLNASQWFHYDFHSF